MSAAVVDTNVLVAANRRGTHVTLGCALGAIGRLRSIRRNEVLVLDDGWRILREYLQQASSAGQPGVGDAFLKWALTQRKNPRRCELVPLTQRSGDPDDFREFPNDPDLVRFDQSDRKFVAVALASKYHPTVVNATDTDWWHFRPAFERHGLEIEFLCPELMSESRAGG